MANYAVFPVCLLHVTWLGPHPDLCLMSYALRNEIEASCFWSKVCSKTSKAHYTEIRIVLFIIFVPSFDVKFHHFGISKKKRRHPSFWFSMYNSRSLDLNVLYQVMEPAVF